MKVIQLGGANDALCHFLSLGGLEFLLDCGLPVSVAASTSDDALRIRLPALHAVDVASLDVVLLSNHYSMLALPFVTEQLGFQGAIYATELTLEFGRILLEELAVEARTRKIVFEYIDPAAAQRQGPHSAIITAALKPFTLADVAACCAKVTCVEYKEVVELSYGVSITALSSGFSLGASTWLIEGPNDQLAYVAAASGDLNRHPKELDLMPLVDCETLLLTDLKPDRDPHTNTERMVERFLTSVSRVIDRAGVCVIPCSPTGVLFDLVEAVYAACVHNKTAVPMYFVAPHASRVMTLTKLGAEWLCEKKVEKLYAGESVFLHETLQKNKLFQVEADISPAMASVFQSASIVFVGHPSLQFGLTPELIRMIGADSRNALLLIDPSVDPLEALVSYQLLEIEKIACPIDPRLSCGDANQFIARCCPKTLIVPFEYTIEPPSTVVGVIQGDQSEFSHFSRVLPLHELTAAKPKTDLLTFPMRALDPIILDKSQKYIDGKLDPSLAAKAVLTEVSGKAAACVSGVLSVKRKAFVLEAPPLNPVPVSSSGGQIGAAVAEGGASKLSGGKRKASNPTLSPSVTTISSSSQRMEYREKSAILLGQVDEDKLEKQVKTHDPQAQVYISQGQGDADVFMSIPSLDARITLWKEAAKTVIETEKEDARALLTSFILAQLVVIQQ